MSHVIGPEHSCRLWPLKRSRRLTDVDDMIVSLYAGGMTIRDIQHHMATAMRVDISHETISAVTGAVLDEVMVWQNRQ